jgi:hypothetical protein
VSGSERSPSKHAAEPCDGLKKAEATSSNEANNWQKTEKRCRGLSSERVSVHDGKESSRADTMSRKKMHGLMESSRFFEKFVSFLRSTEGDRKCSEKTILLYVSQIDHFFQFVRARDLTFNCEGLLNFRRRENMPKFSMLPDPDEFLKSVTSPSLRRIVNVAVRKVISFLLSFYPVDPQEWQEEAVDITGMSI